MLVRAARLLCTASSLIAPAKTLRPARSIKQLVRGNPLAGIPNGQRLPSCACQTCGACMDIARCTTCCPATRMPSWTWTGLVTARAWPAACKSPICVLPLTSIFQWRCSYVYTASADKMVALWDAEVRGCQMACVHHSAWICVCDTVCVWLLVFSDRQAHQEACRAW